MPPDARESSAGLVSVDEAWWSFDLSGLRRDGIYHVWKDCAIHAAKAGVPSEVPRDADEGVRHGRIMVLGVVEYLAITFLLVLQCFLSLSILGTAFVIHATRW